MFVSNLYCSAKTRRKFAQISSRGRRRHLPQQEKAKQDDIIKKQPSFPGLDD